MFNKPEVLVIGRFNGKSRNPSGSSPTYHRVPRPDDKTNRHQWIFVIVILLKCPVLLHEFSVLLFYQYLAGSFSFGKPSCPHVIILICFKFIFLSYSCIASLIFFFFFFLAFQGRTCGVWKFPSQGSNQGCSWQLTPQPQQCSDPSCICSLYHSS